MRTLLFTCDQYVDLVAEHGRLLNKFSPVKREVEVLGFQPPTVEYPENYKFVSLGNQEDYPNKNWSDPIRSTIENIEENHFALHWDDVFPIGPMRERLFEEAIELVKSEEVQKVDFFFGAKNQHATSLPFNDNFVQLSQYVDYRSGLVPGIYNKEYFLKYLDPKMTCWDYEVLNIPRTTNDGAIILLCRDEPILPWINMYDKGEFNINHLKQLQSSKSGRNFGWNPFQKLEEEEYEMFLKHKDITLY